MHVVFIEPSFPANQKQFVRGLAQAGAAVTSVADWSTASHQARASSCDHGSSADSSTNAARSSMALWEWGGAWWYRIRY